MMNSCDRTMRILLVEDEPKVAKHVRLGLTAQGDLVNANRAAKKLCGAAAFAHNGTIARFPQLTIGGARQLLPTALFSSGRS